jgi:hypothetical protein
MILSKPIRYLFFAVYQWHTQSGRAGNPAILPAVIVTILLSLNILVVIQLLMAFGMTIPLFRTFPELSRLLGYGCYLIVGGAVWVLLVRNKAYTQLETEFATASERRKRIRTAVLFFYVVLSICLPFIVRVLTHNARIH